MVVQYPDTIVITREGSSVQDENGNWITTDGETITLKCRFVPNLQVRTVTLMDGTNYTYHYQVAFPKGTTNVKPQDIYKRGDEEGIIKRFEVGQLHSIAWI